MSKTSILAIVALAAGCASDGGAPAPSTSEVPPVDSVVAEVPSASVGGAPASSAVVSAVPSVSAAVSASAAPK